MNFQYYEIIDYSQTVMQVLVDPEHFQLLMEMEYSRTQDNLYKSDTHVNGDKLSILEFVHMAIRCINTKLEHQISLEKISITSSHKQIFNDTDKTT